MSWETYILYAVEVTKYHILREFEKETQYAEGTSKLINLREIDNAMANENDNLVCNNNPEKKLESLQQTCKQNKVFSLVLRKVTRSCFT